jgi:type IV secretory pathway ATPase VirB11/archaellum biosynthesis ATPase
VEDIAINLGHMYIYTTEKGWQYVAPANPQLSSALRILIERANQRPPTPDYPIADAMIQQVIPTRDGQIKRKGIRINYIMPPASPYGDTITLRISSYRTKEDLNKGSLATLCEGRLPPVPRPSFEPRNFPRGNGVLTPEAANYLLSVMVHGGTVVIAGATGSGKTYLAQRLLQDMLNHFEPGAIRLFIIEDSNEIVLNAWTGSYDDDTGNIVYTVTRPETPGGPKPVTMYDLIRAALRSRPHGLIIGEARGAEAWEFVRAAATGHGFSIFTIHATSAEHVWPRFMQVVQSHPDVNRISEYSIAQAFAEAVTAIVYVERHKDHGQIVREIAEVQPVVEKAAARPSLLPLFQFNQSAGSLLPTGSRPNRIGFRPTDLGLPDEYFRQSSSAH